MSQVFKSSANDRLSQYLRKTDQNENFEQLTPDASTREFFRVFANDESKIACIYPEVFDKDLPQIDVTNLFLRANLPVAEIFDVDYELGIVLHEDFGDQILRNTLIESDLETREQLLNDSIALIAKIQSSTPIAYEINSIASNLKFDEEKLVWELNFFKQHYFESLINAPLAAAIDESLLLEFIDLSKQLEKLATVLTHRDFHAANLMVDQKENLRIIDHQDARIGSVAYDLVSLLLDRINIIPSQDWLASKKIYFLNERENLGLEKIDLDRFNYEFDLMTVQRCLKAIGTFSNQAANFGKTQYIQYIDPMFKVVLEASERLERFPFLQNTIKHIIAD